MNKNVLIVILIVVVIAGVLSFRMLRNDISPDQDNFPNNQDTVPKASAAYFMEEIQKRAIANMGAIPVEGFDAELLIGALPGLKSEDFDEVKSFEGKYFFENGTLEFLRTQEQPISTAEKTISEEGYETLLQNVAKRLNAEMDTKADIDALIQTLNEKPKATTQDTDSPKSNTAIQNNEPTSADNAPPGSIHNLPVPPAVAAARAYAAQSAQVNESEVLILTAYEKEWPNACLGLPSEGEMCAEVITPGYEVTLRASGEEFVYRTNSDGSIIRVER